METYPFLHGRWWHKCECFLRTDVSWRRDELAEGQYRPAAPSRRIVFRHLILAHIANLINITTWYLTGRFRVMLGIDMGRCQHCVWSMVSAIRPVLNGSQDQFVMFTPGSGVNAERGCTPCATDLGQHIDPAFSYGPEVRGGGQCLFGLDIPDRTARVTFSARLPYSRK